jgi:hypothetical protein
MANLDKIMPQSFKSFLPFLQEQIDGSKAMLVKIAARDGIVDAVEVLKKQGRPVIIEWTDFDALWESRLRPAYEDALKANPKINSREFVKGEMIRVLSILPVIQGTTPIVDLGDFVARQVQGSPTQKEESDEKPAKVLKDFGLDGWVDGKEREIEAGGIEFRDAGSEQSAYAIGRNEVKIGDARYEVVVRNKNTQTPLDSVKIFFEPHVTYSTLANESKVIYKGVGDKKVTVTLSEIAKLAGDNKTKTSGGAIEVLFTKKV